jgi:hypothetical protein
MPVIEAQCASILVPHDHRHINQERILLDLAANGTRATGGAAGSTGAGSAKTAYVR